jgi:hypothetical protein
VIAFASDKHLGFPDMRKRDLEGNTTDRMRKPLPLSMGLLSMASIYWQAIKLFVICQKGLQRNKTVGRRAESSSFVIPAIRRAVLWL